MPHTIDSATPQFQETHATVANMRQAIILAAGRGRRLGPRVEEFPKCLLKVGGKTLLDHQLAMLAAAGISDICVVTGYHRDVVAHACRNRAHLIHNPDWSTTNSLYSFSLTRHWVKGPVVVMNCDVLGEQSILSRLLKDPSSSFAFDSSSGDDEEHMKVEIVDGYLNSMSKSLDASLVHGENVGMLHFSHRDAMALYEHAEEILEREGRRFWMAAAVEALSQERELRGVDIAGSTWIEIDYQEDLERARECVWPSIERRKLPRGNRMTMPGPVTIADANARL